LRGVCHRLFRTVRCDNSRAAISSPQGFVEDDQVVYIEGGRLSEWLSHQPEGLDRRQQNLFALTLDSGLAVSSSSAAVS
jgi:hypothetical protein